MRLVVGIARRVCFGLVAALLLAELPQCTASDDGTSGGCACGDPVCCGECSNSDCSVCRLLGGGAPGCLCGSLVTPLGGCASGFEMYWVRAEFLALQRDGVALPPLVTTSDPADAAALGQPSTTVLAGNETVGNDWRLGFRLELGFWLNPTTGWALGGDYFNGGRAAYGFRIGPDSTRLLGRPYFDADPTSNVESALIVNDPFAPGTLSGHVSGNVFDDFQGAGAWMQKRVGLWGNPCSPAGGAQLSLLGGYRYYHQDSLVFLHQEYRVVDPTGLPGDPPAGLHVYGSEKFAGRNEFHGGELGLQGRIQRQRWWCEGLAAVALGGTERVVFVEGSSVFIDPDPDIGVSVPGGVLLTSTETNIGRYTDNGFQAVPRFRLGAGWQFNEWLGFRAGYNLVIWEVVQAADHLPQDLRVDSRNIPEVTGGGGADPAFPGIRESTMVSHGLDAGLELSF